MRTIFSIIISIIIVCGLSMFFLKQCGKESIDNDLYTKYTVENVSKEPYLNIKLTGRPNVYIFQPNDHLIALKKGDIIYMVQGKYHTITRTPPNK